MLYNCWVLHFPYGYFRNLCNEMSLPTLQQFTDLISKEKEAKSLLYVSFWVDAKKKVFFNNCVFLSQSQTSCKMQTSDWKCSHENQNSKQAEGPSQVYWLMFCVLVFRTEDLLIQVFCFFVYYFAFCVADCSSLW